MVPHCLPKGGGDETFPFPEMATMYPDKIAMLPRAAWPTAVHGAHSYTLHYPDGPVGKASICVLVRYGLRGSKGPLP